MVSHLVVGISLRRSHEDMAGLGDLGLLEGLPGNHQARHSHGGTSAPKYLAPHVCNTLYLMVLVLLTRQNLHRRLCVFHEPSEGTEMDLVLGKLPRVKSELGQSEAKSFSAMMAPHAVAYHLKMDPWNGSHRRLVVLGYGVACSDLRGALLH